ncbi:MAG: regulatory protein RecX [Clostridia bacterium]|nr:regulatory protein RecX [Clostridia bacterium]
MKIVEIKRDKKHTVKVSFDDGRAYNFDIDYWNNICIRENDEIDDVTLNHHLKESDYIRAKARGIWFLDRSDYSEKTLYQKIVAGGISGTAAARAVARLKELGLVDDEKLARRLAEQMSDANISKRESYAKLYNKGIPSAIIKSVLEDTNFDELSQVLAVIEKKYRNKMSEKQDIQKVYAALIRKGFSYASVRDAIKKYTQEIEFYEED